MRAKHRPVACAEIQLKAIVFGSRILGIAALKRLALAHHISRHLRAFRHCSFSPLLVRIQDARRQQPLWRMKLKNFWCPWLSLRGEFQFSHLFFRIWHIRQASHSEGVCFSLSCRFGLPVVLVGTTAGHVSARLKRAGYGLWAERISGTAILALRLFLIREA
jgi:hypothetical protein